MSTLAELQDKFVNDAIKAINEDLPKKVLELDRISVEMLSALGAVNVEDYIPSEEVLLEYTKAKLLAEERNKDSEGANAKKRKLENGEALAGKSLAPQQPVVEQNPVIVNAIKQVSQQVTECLEILTTIKTWIQLNIPRIEDGNNFGVAVQEECISEMSRVEDGGFNVLDNSSKYHHQRARLAHKMVKHSDVADYRLSLIECDYTQVEVLKLTIIEVRNSLAVVHDLLLKNFDKIKKPRTENSAHMY